MKCNALAWDALDIIWVSGDSYIDSPYIGVAVIGNMLAQAGFLRRSDCAAKTLYQSEAENES